MAIKIRNFEYENMKMACFVLLVRVEEEEQWQKQDCLLHFE